MLCASLANGWWEGNDTNPVLMDQIRLTYSVPARLKALGISPANILRRAHLPPTLFQQGRIVVTTAQWFALWQALATSVDDPAFGLKLSRMVKDEPYDSLAITALSAPSFQAALHKVARYKRLFSAEDIHLTHHGSASCVEVVWIATEKPPPPLLIDATFSHLIELGQRGTGQPLYPDRVTFRREAIHRSIYEAYFQCPIDFNADHDTLLFRDTAMTQPFLTANPDLLALLEPQLEIELRNHLTHQGFIDQVTFLLRSRIAGQSPMAQDIASELNMSTRTLQRRLADDGVSFQHLLETVRHEMAKEYLSVSPLELNEIAFLLGYKEVSSFHRAFQHWEGLSPGQWRTMQR